MSNHPFRPGFRKQTRILQRPAKTRPSTISGYTRQPERLFGGDREAEPCRVAIWAKLRGLARAGHVGGVAAMPLRSRPVKLKQPYSHGGARGEFGFAEQQAAQHFPANRHRALAD